PGQIDLGVPGLTGAHLAAYHPGPVDDQAGDRRLYIVDFDLTAAHADDAGVRLLTTAFGVERGSVEDQLQLGAFAGRRERRAVRSEQGTHPRLPLRLVVAGELHLAALLQHPPVGREVGVAGLTRLRVRLCPGPLLGHQPAETLFIHAQALLGREPQGEIDREAVGVVQLERLVTGDVGPPGRPGLRDRGVQDGGPGLERAEERLLLAVGVLR